MNFRLEIRYAVLISLLMLLWLAIEFMLGLHDNYIQYHPYVTMFALVIPIAGSYLAIKSKREEQNGHITFKQALRTGIVIALFSALFTVPVQLAFHFIINPDFFDNMIAYAVKHAELLKMDAGKATADAQNYFSLSSYITMSFLGTLVFGSLIALILALVMRDRK